MIDGASSAAALVDGPNDERLATATVTGDKDAFDVGGKLAVLADKGLPVATRVLRLESKHFADFQFRADKAGSQ